MSLRVGIVGWGEIARVHASKLEAAGAQVLVWKRRLVLK